MKALLLAGALACSACTATVREDVQAGLDLSEDACRSYLTRHPTDTGKFALACVKLLQVKVVIDALGLVRLVPEPAG